MDSLAPSASVAVTAAPSGSLTTSVRGSSRSTTRMRSASVVATRSASVPSNATRPPSITTIRSHSRWTSPMSCVVRRSVVPRSARSRARKRRRFSLLIMSRPIVGSSSTARAGECSRAAATSPRMRCPSDSVRTGRARNDERSSSSASTSNRRSQTARGIRCMAARIGKDSSNGRSHHSAERCPNTTPILRASTLRSGTGRSPQVRTLPEVGVRMPETILMVVDFPEPFAPM